MDAEHAAAADSPGPAAALPVARGGGRVRRTLALRSESASRPRRRHRRRRGVAGGDEESTETSPTHYEDPLAHTQCTYCGAVLDPPGTDAVSGCGGTKRTRGIEVLPEEILLEILSHLRPPEAVGLVNCSPLLNARFDKPMLWKGLWFWLAEEFSGAVTVHRLLARAGQEGAFGWKMLVLLDWRFQQVKLSYAQVRSVAKEWCARLREVGLVLGVTGVSEGIRKIHALLMALRLLYTGQSAREAEGDDDPVSTEDEYEHDKEWEMAMVAGMALANVRREVLSSLSLRGVDVDRLPRHYERIFSRFRDVHHELPVSPPRSPVA